MASKRRGGGNRKFITKTHIKSGLVGVAMVAGLSYIPQARRYLFRM